ncbi:MAG: hypothetical protein CBB72_011635 [Muricauda sp. TMED12]|nr:MAG: hypothetical protein CBB72_011635 [Muricauda sp. TMED12]
MTDAELERRIITKKRFSEEVEKVIVDRPMPFMDAVLTVCENKQIDPGDVRRLLTDSIRGKIEAEAMNLNLLPKPNELPFDD